MSTRLRKYGSKVNEGAYRLDRYPRCAIVNHFPLSHSPSILLFHLRCWAANHQALSLSECGYVGIHLSIGRR
jgi:hypothetical protein